ncbi:MAG: DUF1684 domain-containing protein [Planctomycetota bacterium]
MPAARAGFGGIERFRVSETWRITAAFEPAPSGARVGIETVIGVRMENPIAGRARFERGGVEVEAVLFPGGDDGGLFLMFADTTNGAETYTIGRFLDVEATADGETVVLDFNRAYSPPCAFTPFATCPLPHPDNRFPFAVEAGERWSGH